MNCGSRVRWITAPPGRAQRRAPRRIDAAQDREPDHEEDAGDEHRRAVIARGNPGRGTVGDRPERLAELHREPPQPEELGAPVAAGVR